MKLFIVILLTLAVWSYPLKTASALLTETKIEEIKEQPNVQSTSVTEQPTVQKQISKSTSTNSGRNTPAYTGKSYTKEEVIQLIKDYSARYGISPEKPLRIAKCESNYNQFAKNKSSSASGVFQFLNSTWATKPLAQQGASVWDADANVHTAVWLMSLGKYSMWECK